MGVGGVNWRGLARKDFRDAVRSRSVVVLLAGFLLVYLLIGYAGAELVGDDFDAVVSLAGLATAFVLPIVSLGVGYKSIIAARSSGTIALALSLPHSRLDLAVGTFVGRAGVVLVPAVAGLAVTAAVAGALIGPPPAAYLGLVAVTVLYGLAFLGIAVGVSMGVSTSRRATGGAFGAYVLFVALYDQLIQLLVVVVFRFQTGAYTGLPDWARLAQHLGPPQAYSYAVSELFDEVSIVTEFTTTPPPDWFIAPVAVLVLAGWVGLSLAVGYRRFRRAEL